MFCRYKSNCHITFTFCSGLFSLIIFYEKECFTFVIERIFIRCNSVIYNLYQFNSSIFFLISFIIGQKGLRLTAYVCLIYQGHLGVGKIITQDSESKECTLAFQP